MEIQELQSNIINTKESQKNIQCESKFFIYEKIKENERFGKWITTNQWKKRGSSWYLKCKCDCGLENDVLAYDLIRKTSTKCKSCRTIERNLKHGENCHGNVTYEYRHWQNLKYKNLLNDDWKNNYRLFIKDVGKRPENGFILQRKNYSILHSLSNSFWGHPKLRFFEDIQGNKYGEWTTIEKDLLGKGIRWLCECSCGKKDYIPQTNLLRKISTKCKSCTMKGKGLFKIKYGLRKNPLYNIYNDMKYRCLNKNNSCFKHYGGRGIKVCNRWLESFQNFLDDMGERPSIRHSLDRIDVNGNYCPENCKWSTKKEQVNNRRKIEDLQNEILFLKNELKKYEKKADI